MMWRAQRINKNIEKKESIDISRAMVFITNPLLLYSNGWYCSLSVSLMKSFACWWTAFLPLLISRWDICVWVDTYVYVSTHTHIVLLTRVLYSVLKLRRKNPPILFFKIKFRLFWVVILHEFWHYPVDFHKIQMRFFTIIRVYKPLSSYKY